MIYLDYAAQAPVDNCVLDLFYNVTKKYYANPNSSHKLGLEAKRLIDDYTINIANNLKILPEEIIYTSGASESNNLAIKGICERYKSIGKHILIGALEHSSIVAAATVMQDNGFEVEIIPINSDGLIDIDEFKKMIRDDTILVSICALDSEIGLKQPIKEIGDILKSYPNCFFHTDASQAIGKIEIDFTNVDLATVTPHKFYGLNGFGMLIKKKNVSLKPQINGGRSTTVYRSGTPELANIAACSKALEIALKNMNDRYNYVKKISDKVKKELLKYKNVHINNTMNSVPFIINFSIKKIESIELQKKLEEHDVYVSTKTSCCPLKTPSKLVYALTHDKGLSTSSIRVSLSHLTTEKEIDEFLRIFKLIYKEYEDNGKI